LKSQDGWQYYPEYRRIELYMGALLEGRRQFAVLMELVVYTGMVVDTGMVARMDKVHTDIDHKDNVHTDLIHKEFVRIDKADYRGVAHKDIDNMGAGIPACLCDPVLF
jgi:hypothetical protein